MVTVIVTADTLQADLMDGRTIAVPLAWYPRLVHATQDERNRWELHAAGLHIHWPDLDEDVSVEALLAGRLSGESRKSLKRWLEAKRAGRSLTLYDLRNTDSGERLTPSQPHVPVGQAIGGGDAVVKFANGIELEDHDGGVLVRQFDDAYLARKWRLTDQTIRLVQTALDCGLRCVDAQRFCPPKCQGKMSSM